MAYRKKANKQTPNQCRTQKTGEALLSALPRFSEASGYSGRDPGNRYSSVSGLQMGTAVCCYRDWMGKLSKEIVD